MKSIKFILLGIASILISIFSATILSIGDSIAFMIIAIIAIVAGVVLCLIGLATPLNEINKNNDTVAKNQIKEQKLSDNFKENEE